MKIKKAFFVGTNGVIRRLESLEGKEMSFKEMYPIIGCYTIEHVGLKKGVDMWCDEEGLFKNPVVNHNATLMYRAAYPKGGFPGETNEDLMIVGNAIVTDNTKAGDYLGDESPFGGENNYQAND